MDFRKVQNGILLAFVPPKKTYRQGPTLAVQDEVPCTAKEPNQGFRVQAPGFTPFWWRCRRGPPGFTPFIGRSVAVSAQKTMKRRIEP